MSAKSKRIVESSGSDSDSGPDERNEPPPKKGKPNAEPPQSKRKPAPKPKTEEDNEDNMFLLGRMRYATVREFRGRVMIDVREYYHDAAGDLKPGKKGIALTVEQWNALKSRMDDIDEALKSF